MPSAANPSSQSYPKTSRMFHHVMRTEGRTMASQTRTTSPDSQASLTQSSDESVQILSAHSSRSQLLARYVQFPLHPQTPQDLLRTVDTDANLGPRLRPRRTRLLRRHEDHLRETRRPFHTR
jgi:hypothetical protein